MLNYTEVNDLLCLLGIIPAEVWSLWSSVFNWLGLAQEDASLDFGTKGTLLFTGVHLADS